MLKRIKKSIFPLIMSIIGIYFFITFDDWMNKNFIDGAIDTNGRLYRSILFFLSQNKVGYWVVRGGIILGTTIFFIRAFVGSLKGEKGW